MPRESHFGTVAYKRSKSVTTAMNALRFLVEYGRAADKLGDDLSIEDYAAHLGMSRANAFRRQAAFRTCFPSDDVLVMWKVVKPTLDGSSFRHEPARAQAMFVASMKCGLS